MSDTDCISFLQWALPQLELSWPGFRKVRRQVCKRLRRRMRDLGLDSFSAYRARLEADASEWRTFDQCCHVTVSRFFRDRGIFEAVRRRVLPDIAALAEKERRDVLAWSAGCASGEEPYTLRILWDVEIAGMYPSVSFSIIASDIDKSMLTRAHRGCFKSTSLHELPLPLVEKGFDRFDSLYCVKPKYREGIEFIEQDLRSEMPAQSFDLVLCRYVAFTYFSAPLQAEIMVRMLERLRPNGYFVIGAHEKLPRGTRGLESPLGEPGIFQKRAMRRT